MVKVSDAFDSHLTAASKAAYARGFAIVISKSIHGSSKVLGFSCRRGMSDSGPATAQRCRFRLEVEVSEDDDGEEAWNVIRLDEQHNHLSSTQEDPGEWK